MDEGRGFTVSHQRVVLDLDWSGVITASAHITIKPTQPSLKTVYLHASPLLRVSNVTLSTPTPSDLLPTPASFALSQPLLSVPKRQPPISIKSHTEVKRKTWSALSDHDAGELAIAVTGGWIRLNDDSTALAEIDIRVDYQLGVGGQVVEGIVFDGESVYLSPTAYDSARVWTPCVDSLWERHTWELEFTVPAKIGDAQTMVVASGELMEQTTHPHSPSKTIFYYMHAYPISVQHITFAAGPFETHVIAESPKAILGFCLPGDLDHLVNSTGCLPTAMDYYTKEIGRYPYSEYKVVFLPETRSQCTTGVTMSILSTDLLYPPDVIDQGVPTRQTLALALIQQWIGIAIIQRTLSDTWLVHGLALYISSLFLRQLLGNNEYRFRLKRDIERCARLDQGDQWPLCVPGILEPPDTSFINLKAPLVLHILDRFIAKSGTSLGLSRVIPRIFLEVAENDDVPPVISTQRFFKTCRQVSGIDLKAFQDQWVYGSGCPQFRIVTNFIRKKFIVEFTVLQEPKANERRAVPMFEGSLTVRIHEADGAPFEHVVDVKAVKKKAYNLPFNTKYKRTRRSGIGARFKKLLEEQADDDEEESQPVLTQAFSYPPWDDEEEKARWRVAEWSDEQVEQMLSESGGYEWIRIDPDCEWIATFDFTEKPWNWISQLQSDRDVAAQLEAVQHLAAYPYPIIASELVRTIMVKNYFYRIRMEAAKALTNYSNADAEYMGRFYLLKAFQQLYSDDDSDPEAVTFVTRKNDFSDLADYFAIITALAALRDPTSRSSWRNVRKFLLGLLDANDNTSNPYNDSQYLASLLAAIGNAYSSMSVNDEADKEDMNRAVDVISRTMTMDRLVPSYQNVVTQAGIKAHLKLIIAGKISNSVKIFLPYTREGNYEPLRLLAFDCLMIARPPGRSSALLAYLADVIRHDSSLIVRRHVARALSEGMIMSLAFGDVHGTLTSGVDEASEDNSASRDKREFQIVKALRKDFGKQAMLMDTLQAEFIASCNGIDHDIRFAMIKAAELTTSADLEMAPGHSGLSVPLVTPRVTIKDVKAKEPPAAESVQVLKLKLNHEKEKKKKKKPVPKWQENGLPDSDKKAIDAALAKLVGHRTNYLFANPVDLKTFADYGLIVTRPMDLKTIQARLDGGVYGTRDDFVKDVKQIVENCRLYNQPKSAVWKEGESFNSFFEKTWRAIEATLKVNETAPDVVRPPVITIPRPQAPAPPAPPTKKVVVKTNKAVAIDPKPQHVGTMAPPPLPPSRKPSFSITFGGEASKKRKTANDLDDMLGAEVDAMSSLPSDSFEQLLEPKAKKPKIPKPSPDPPSRAVSPEKRKEKKVREAPPPPPPAQAAPAAPAAAIGSATVPAYVSPVPPADLPPTGNNVMPFRPKRARNLVSTLLKDPNAIYFQEPVDPLKHGCLDYFDEIKHPMDLGTVMKKVEQKKYRSMGQLASDIELVFNNCRKYNNFGDPLYVMADATQVTFWQEWPKAVSPRMTPSEKKDMAALLNKAIKDDRSLWFRVKVDPVAMNIPNYFDIIDPEEARDLSLIKSNLDKGVYTAASKVDEDVTLMLENARIFNAEGPVVDAANDFGRWWKAQRSRMD